jgi:sugar lactone lactonase YvrE
MFELMDESVSIEQIGTGYTFTEGPVWDHHNRRLLFVDFRGDTVFQWRAGSTPVVLRRPSHGNNGNTFDSQGRLVSCLAEPGHVSRTEHDGSLTVLVSEYQGKQLNAPNDLVYGPDGSLYFTDTPYLPPGRMEQPRGVPFYGVYRFSPDGQLSVMADDLDPPNGIAVSSDGSRLYANDTAHHAIYTWDLMSDGKAVNRRQFADTRHGEIVGRPDGMKLDSLGNLYLTANTENGIWIYNPDGGLAGFIELPEAPENCAWGDDDWQTLYVTAKTSVYRVRMKVAGQPVG